MLHWIRTKKNAYINVYMYKMMKDRSKE